jgi:hypothetical protein
LQFTEILESNLVLGWTLGSQPEEERRYNPKI